jgi:hypothetical protein
MKQLIMITIFLIGLSLAASAQNGPVNYDPIAVALRNKHQDTTYSLLTQYQASQLYRTISQPKEVAAAHNYTVTGAPLVYISATNNDTVNLVRGDYVKNQIIQFVRTNSSNDSTVFLPDYGTINGATSYKCKGYYTGLILVMDSTNYWTLSNQ